MRRVVVFPQPDGPRRAKKEPCGISSEIPSTATVSSKRLTTLSSRTSTGTDAISARPSGCSYDLRSRWLVHVGAPVVRLLPELEVEEALGRDHVRERADPVGDAEQRTSVGADELDEHVELPGGDNDVVGLLPAGDLVGDLIGRPGGADAHHRLRLEAEAEWVRDAGDLEDVVGAEARVAGADRRLRDAERDGDAAERLPPV